MKPVLMLLAAALLAAALLPATPTRAESWCASPLFVHEWGVQSFGSPGADRSTTPGPRLPSYFHHGAGNAGPTKAPVRHLPPDGGERALPVLHFYSPAGFRPVPVGIEVGFTEGEATSFFPQVDVLRPAAVANAPAALAARRELLRRRGQPSMAARGLPSDPTRQLVWNNLTLTGAPQRAAPSTSSPWVRRLRGFDQALWVANAHESERFVFYEARTQERPALRLARGPTYGSGRRHYIVHNDGAQTAHDVFFVHREARRRFVFFMPAIPSGASAGFVLEDHEVPRGRWRRATRARLEARLVDGQQPSAPTEYRWGPSCVMQRDPAQPVERAEGHRLYADEVDVVLDLWDERFFGAAGTTLVYREDEAYLDDVMPLSVYTDMYHFVELRRLGLAVVEGVALP